MVVEEDEEKMKRRSGVRGVEAPLAAVMGTADSGQSGSMKFRLKGCCL